ncbi:MAG TPA: hypothetical protein VHN98_10225 [Acidimicrobiales bacterium]|nr:hypothetical protein [Acidimicrobiales bacterium]
MSDERAKEGVEHLQAAALEVISAVRAFLDVAEQVVREPGRAAAFASDLVDLGRMAAGAAAAAAAPSAAPGPSGPTGQNDTDASPVSRIRVS